MPRKADPLPIIDADVEAPAMPVAPQPGTPADVTVKFRTNVDPNEAQRGSRARRFYDDDDDPDPLIEQAAIDLEPPDAFAQFCDEFSEYIGRANVEIVRQPDPADKRRPGNTYRRSNFTEYERLGNVPFDPGTLLSSIQFINNDSGGVFRLWLIDANGAMIHGARLDRLAIADPPSSGAASLSTNASTTAPATMVERERPASEEEKQLREIQRQLLTSALDRLMHPPAAPASDPLAMLPPEDRVAMLLVQKGDVLSQAFAKVTSMMQASNPEVLGERLSWKERALERAYELAINNPELGHKVTDLITTIVNRLFAGPTSAPQYVYVRQPQSQSPPQPQSRPQPTPQAPIAPQPQATQVPDAPDIDNDDPDFDDAPELSEDEIDIDMSLLEDLTAFLSGNEPITGDSPIFAQLLKEYPRRFPFYLGLIAQAPSVDFIIEFIIKFTVAQETQLYKNLLTGPLREHYRARLEAVRQLCIDRMRAPAPGQTNANTIARDNQQAQDSPRNDQTTNGLDTGNADPVANESATLS